MQSCIYLPDLNCSFKLLDFIYFCKKKHFNRHTSFKPICHILIIYNFALYLSLLKTIFFGQLLISHCLLLILHWMYSYELIQIVHTCFTPYPFEPRCTLTLVITVTEVSTRSPVDSTLTVFLWINTNCAYLLHTVPLWTQVHIDTRNHGNRGQYTFPRGRKDSGHNRYSRSLKNKGQCR